MNYQKIRTEMNKKSALNKAAYNGIFYHVDDSIKFPTSKQIRCSINKNTMKSLLSQGLIEEKKRTVENGRRYIYFGKA